MDEPRLSIRNLGKAYNVPVLHNVGLDLARGEIHALVGENGAGKSTLVNILAGLVAPDSGDVLLDGERYAPGSPVDAFAAGVSFTTQELSIIETLTVAENIGLRAMPSLVGVVDRTALAKSARRSLEKVGLAGMPANTQAGDLGLGGRQLVEIARAINADCRLLMMDEPTAALTSQQADIVHELVRDIAGGGASVIYVSHRLDDVLDIADRVTVLRDGVVISTAMTSDVSAATLVEQMSGSDVHAAAVAAPRDDADPLSLSVVDLATDALPFGVSLDLRRGEVIGLAGLAGAGKSELLAAIFGLAPLTGGAVQRRTAKRVGDIQNPRQAVRSGIGYLGEDRRTMGIFPGQSVLTNIMLPDLAGPAARVIDKETERERVTKLRGRIAIQCDSLAQDIRQLSGGNQQKVLLARWLNCGADVLLLDEPTRGVDVATKNAIHELFAELAADGKSLIIASSELEEMMAVCHRILVLSNRRVVAEFDRETWSERDILTAAFSEHASRNRDGARQAERHT